MRTSNFRRKQLISAAAVVATTLMAGSASAGDGFWSQTTSGGLWSVTTNWFGGNIADGSGFTADFSTINITVDNTVRLDSSRTLSNLIFGDLTTASNGWTLDNNGNVANVLTLDGTATVNVGALGAGKRATISAILNGTAGLNKTGIGTLALSGSNTFSGPVVVNQGTLLASKTAALPGYNTLGTISVGSGATMAVSAGIAGEWLGADIDTLRANATFNAGSFLGIDTASGNFSYSLGADTTGAGLSKSGANTLTLTGTNTYAGTTLVSVGTIDVSGGTVVAAGLATVNNGAKLLVQSGSATFNGGVATNNSDGAFIHITGGTVTATDINLLRTFNGGTAAAPTSGQTANGLYVNGAGAVVNLGSLRIGTSNAGASVRLDAGTMSATGQVLVGANTNTGRWNIFDINGGRFTSTDTTTGVVVGAATGSASFTNRALMLVRGGITTVNKLSFGTSTATFTAGTQIGTVTLSGASTGLYVGGGGISVNLNADNITPATGTFIVNLNGGTLGADADFVGSTNMSFGGAAIIKAANEADAARNISLTGVLSGSNAWTKSGGGTLSLAGNSTYTGLTTVTAGTLKLAGVGDGTNSPLGTVAAGTVINSGATLDLNGQNLSTAEALTINGTGISGGGALSNSSATGATFGGLVTLGSAASIVANNGDINLTNPGTITGPGLGLTLGGTNAASSIASIIGTGTGTVTKTGTGTWTLSGTNTYSGSTTVSQGTLKVLQTNTLSGSNNVIIAAGATLDATTSGHTIGSGKTLAGHGTVTGSVTGVSGSNLTPGSIGGTTTTFTVGNLTLDGGSLLNLDLEATSGVSDLTTVSNVFTLPTLGTINVNLAGIGAATTGNNYTIFQAGSIVNFDPSDFTVVAGGTAGLTYTFGSTGTAITLAITGIAAANSTWINTGGGSWSTAGNWNPAAVPQFAGDTANFGNAILAPSTVTLDGSKSVGQLNFNSANAYTIDPGSGGTLTLDNGAFAPVVSVANGSHTVNVPVALVANGVAVTVTNSADTLTLNGSVSGASGAVTKSGSGTLALMGSNSYGGGTTINGGVVKINSASSLGASGGVAKINSGTLQAIASMTTARNFELGSATSTIQVDGGATNVEITGTVADGVSAGNLIKTGAGTLTLPATNTYSGETQIIGGVLSTGAAGTLANGGSPSSIGQSSNAASKLVLDGGTLQYASAGAATSTDRLFTLTSNGGAIDASGTNPLTIAGNGANSIATLGSGTRTLTLTGSNTGLNTLMPIIVNGAGGATSVAKSGVGTWVLGTDSTYSGATTISAGTLQLDTTSATGTSAVSVNVNGGLTFGPSVSASTLGSLAGTGNIALDNVTPAPVALTVGSNGQSSSYSGALTGSGSLTKTGAGVLTLSGASNYTGATAVNGGTISLDAGSISGTSSLSVTSTVSPGFKVNGGSLGVTGTTTVGIGSTLLVSTGSATFNGLVSTNANNGVFQVDGGTAALNGGWGISNIGATSNSVFATFRITGGTVTATDINVARNSGTNFTSPGGLQVTGGSLTAGTIQLGTEISTGTMNQTGGTVNVTTMTIGALSGNPGRGGSLTVSGTGVFNASEIVLSKTNGAQAGSVAVANFNGGTSTVDKFTFGFDNTVTGGSGTVNMDGGTLYVGSNMDVNGNGGFVPKLALTSGILGAKTNWTSAVPITLGGTAAGGVMTIQAADAANVARNITLNGVISNAAFPSSIVKTGAGTLTLNAVNTYTGSTTVSAGKLVTVNALQNNGALVITGTGAATDGVVDVPTTIDAGPVPLSGLASGVTALSSLTITPNGINYFGTFDLHNNDLVVNYGGNPTVYTDILNMVKSGLPLLGFGGNGTGITSTEVIAQGAGGIGLNGAMLGVVDGGTSGGQVTTLSGFALANPTQSVLVKYTWRGDTNLDGVVNGSDYALADTGFSGGGTGWFYGDVNYDGVINGSDYALIDTGFSSQTGPLPEPAMLSLLGLGAMGMLRRRRRA
ncbi:MAG: autotransporter-associated beta strand repeat-containing protein [Burkholderiales bacterium]|nr:autotransporter-associated beta strand repeat-containing protein [Phycisphaerae bacterium]